MKKTVSLDVDGVLADFEKYFSEIFGNLYKNLVSLEERYPKKVQKIQNFVANPDTYSDLELLEIGSKLANYFDYSGYKIHVNTSRQVSAKAITHLWLRQHKIPFCKLYIGRKLDYIKETMPDFVVDDMLSVVYYAANDLDIPSFLVDHPWNQTNVLPGNIHRIHNYDEFLSIMDRIY